ncbi:MAG TPA: hypothetical protein VMX54_10535 [Vicinamibacteria bacterium]|nr:hypothetical protein [Vicinamibacteria bacterium]
MPVQVSPGAGEPAPLRRRRGWTDTRVALLACLCLAFGVYWINLDDYFLGDDFDLIGSFYGAPPRYFFELLYNNESGSAWKNLGIDSAQGHGYLRPLKIWLLKADLTAWGARPLGFHLTATLLFGLLLFATYRLIDLALPNRREFALLGAALVGIHPAFAEIVPFLTAREETLAALFVVAAVVALVSHRARGSSPSWFTLFLALGLLSKESAIVALPLAVGWDLVHGHLRLYRTRELRCALRVYGPSVLLLVVYGALRRVAFGNLLGGEGPTAFLSARAWLWFHARLFSSLIEARTFAGWWIPNVGWLMAGLALLTTSIALARTFRTGGWRALLFFGPVWYLGATSILHGTYFSHRHNAVVAVGAASFAAVVCSALAGAAGPGGRRLVAAAAFALGALAWLPPTLAMERRFDQASGVVSDVRRRIEAATAHLPEGSAVKIVGVPQQAVPPYYFGWGLVSSLKRPFTPSDVGNRLVLVNRRNLMMNGSPLSRPRVYALKLDFRSEEAKAAPPTW